MANHQENTPNEYNSKKPYVIVCEGKDDKDFLSAYLKYLAENYAVQNECYNIWTVGGLDNMKKEMRNYKRYANYDDMKAFLFICDADRDADAASRSLTDHIQRTWKILLNRYGDFQEDDDGIKVGFYIMPGVDDAGQLRDGALEDLCLDLLNMKKEPIKTSELMECVNHHIDMVEEKRHCPLKRKHKNRLYLAFSSTDSFLNANFGEAAKWGAFDFSSEKLSRLKDMILRMQE